MNEKSLVLILLLAVAVCAAGEGRTDMKITSAAFAEGGLIPSKYTCDGPNVSPPLEWGAAPAGVKAFVLICDDPDAPAGTWVHWVIYDIPGTALSLEEGLPSAKTLPSGAIQGVNDFRRIGYGGPCPPGGTHRYYFKLYALDAPLKLAAGASKSQLLKAMEGRVLASAQLMGKYKR